VPARRLAAKPQAAGNNSIDVIQRSNGFPNGAHFNLNIHGKSIEFICNETPGGNSVFVDEYGAATIQYVTNKKSPVTELYVIDPCAMDGGDAMIQLPYEAEGYYVFARILAKPNNGQNPGSVSSIILEQNTIAAACNDGGTDPDFGMYTDCQGDWALGLIWDNNVYVAESETYIRFAQTTGGKGKSKATDITRLFVYVGWVYDARLDLNGDGVIDELDIPADAGTYVIDTDTNGIIDFEEWRTFWATTTPAMVWYYSPEDPEWIFNIADLVVTEQGLVKTAASCCRSGFTRWQQRSSPRTQLQTVNCSNSLFLGREAAMGRRMGLPIAGLAFYGNALTIGT